MDRIKTIRVRLDNEMVELSSPDDEDHLLRLAEYVNGKIAEIRSQRKTIPINHSLMKLLLSLNIADDYFKELDKNKALTKELDSFITEMGLLQEENIALMDKIDELRLELARVRK